MELKLSPEIESSREKENEADLDRFIRNISHQIELSKNQLNEFSKEYEKIEGSLNEESLNAVFNEKLLIEISHKILIYGDSLVAFSSKIDSLKEEETKLVRKINEKFESLNSIKLLEESGLDNSITLSRINDLRKSENIIKENLGDLKNKNVGLLEKSLSLYDRVTELKSELKIFLKEKKIEAEKIENLSREAIEIFDQIKLSKNQLDELSKEYEKIQKSLNTVFDEKSFSEIFHKAYLYNDSLVAFSSKIDSLKKKETKFNEELESLNPTEFLERSPLDDLIILKNIINKDLNDLKNKNVDLRKKSLYFRNRFSKLKSELKIFLKEKKIEAKLMRKKPRINSI